jgi:hypothetical protein
MRQGDTPEREIIMASWCNKTEAGRTEIRARALPLSRPRRNLLLIVDNSRSIQEWLGLVQGAVPGDVQGLLAHGLITFLANPAPSRSAGPARTAHREASTVQLMAAINTLTYDQLYTLLTNQTKEHFGLIKGYRFILEVEKCARLSELRDVARRLLTELKQEPGATGVRDLQLALGMQG